MDNSNYVTLLRRAAIFIEDGNWSSASDYCGKVLDLEPENAEAYLYQVMAELRCKTKECLKNHILENGIPISSSWKRAEQFADLELKNWFFLISNEIEVKTITADKVLSAFRKKLEQSYWQDCMRDLDDARSRLNALTFFSEYFGDILSNIRDLMQQKAAMESQCAQLKSQRSKLGFFSYKEKCRLDDELTAMATEIQSIVGKIQEEKRRTRGFSTKEELEKAVAAAQFKVNELEQLLAQQTKSVIGQYSFEEAQHIYRDDVLVRRFVNEKDPLIQLKLDVNSGASSVFFGHYWQDNTTQDKQPIEWIILKQEENRILVISKYALEHMPFNKERVDFTWETCSARMWLNDVFIREAFSPEEQAFIPKVHVRAERNEGAKSYAGNATVDRVFLLSISEAKTLFKSDNERACKATEYCYSRGASREENGNVTWWLRTAGDIQTVESEVCEDGYISTIGQFGDLTGNTLRPAIWIDLKTP